VRSVALIPAAILLLASAAYPADKKGNPRQDPSRVGDRDVGKGINLYSIEKEIALGKQLAQEVARQAKLAEDPLVTEFVNRLGQNLVRNSDAKVPFSFQVIESDLPNAFALPGGFVFVHTGLIKMADEEAELAGALAHEIAHVAARHMTRQATKSQLANLATIPLSVILGGWTGYAARQAAGMAIPMTFLSFSRHDESEADYLGVQYMYAAGYDPTSSVALFEKLESLEKKKPGRFGKLLSTHPPDGERMTKVQQEIQTILPSRAEYVVNTSEYAAMRERLFRERPRRNGQPDRPTLRKRSTSGTPEPGDTAPPEDRPTIRRRELID
jgi:beta-barrel assembly-enhancing protease